MRPLTLLRPSLIGGIALLMLLNCSSSSPESDRNAASNASGSDGATNDGATSDGATSNGATSDGATSDGAGDTSAGPTGTGGTGDAAAAVTSSGDGSGATTSGDSSAATTTSDGSSTSNTTGPIFLTGVGGTFVGSRDDTDACQGLEIAFTPQIPTVFILVDRSTSMWDNMFWDPLRDGVLEVVSRLHEDVRFGFGTYTGEGSSCPLDLEDVGIIDKNNYAAIEGFYTPIMHPGVATETPTPTALRKAQDILKADFAGFPGPKFILLVTDGNPDYCDSGQVECRADVTVRVLQNLHADTEVPIRTFVVALPDPGIDQDWLQAFANAGAGQPVAAPRETEFCDDIPAASAALLPELDPAVWPQGTYGETMGPEVPYNVDPAQQDQLVEEISGVIAGVKSCTFDLEGELQIVAGREDEGTVVIQTISVPTGTAQTYAPDGGDGWRVNDGTQIELVGASCEALRDPETTGIQFGFPCDIIIPK